MALNAGPAATWTNWAGHQQATGIEVLHPRGTDEIAEALAAASASGRGAGLPDPVGALVSCSPPRPRMRPGWPGTPET